MLLIFNPFPWTDLKNSSAIRKSMWSLTKVDIFQIFVAFLSLVKIKTLLELKGRLVCTSLSP